MSLPLACLLGAPGGSQNSGSPICQHPNDFDFCFCQRCGYHRKILKAATIRQVPVHLDAIDARVQQLLNYEKNTGYAKQKDLIQKELEGFLSALPGYVTLATHSARYVSFSSL